MPQVTIPAGSGARTIKDDGSAPIFSGLLAKVVLFFDRDGRLLASHCESDRLRSWIATLAGQPISGLPEPLQQLLKEASATEAAVCRAEFTLTHAGASRPERFQATAAPSFADTDKRSRTGVTVAIYDLSPLPEPAQSLGKLLQLASIGSLSAALSHEIKNALVAINTFVELASVTNTKTGAELAPIAAREVRRINDLVAQLLRASAPKHTSPQPIRVHELLEHALTITEHRTAGSRILIQRTLAAESDLVIGDSGQLEQAFINLLFNAVEAMGNQGTLSVTTSVASREDRPPVVRITIGDTGGGIAQDVIHRLFEPFFTTKATGHGLGLVITHRIILDHGGEIRVQSQAGAGTMFTIDLPSASHQP